MVAIATLLLNDQVLKHAAPSELTGKLSDFSGLFFAPYLALCAVFAVGLGRADRRAIGVARLAYITFATVFTALKVSDPIAESVAGLAEHTGLPITITVDPNDLFALSVLPVSYALWRSRLRSFVTTPGRLRPRQIIVLAAAAAAASATSGPPGPEVTSIAVDGNGDVYATVEHADPASGVYVLHRADGWRRLTNARGPLVPDPNRPGTVYVLHDTSSPSVDRLTGGTAESLGPHDTPRNPQNIFLGPSLLAVAPWAKPAIFLGRNGELVGSRDDGKTWQRILTPGELKAIAVASEQDLVYILTGSTLTPEVAWIYRSRDAGAHWTYMHSISPGSFDAGTLAVDPRDGQIVLVASRKVVERSADSALTFETVYTEAGPGDPDLARWIIRFDPSDPGHVYVVDGFGCCPLLESRDDGRTWSQTSVNAIEVAVGTAGDAYAVGPNGSKVFVRSIGGEDWIDVTGSLPVARSR
jgi:hypothetical protein